MPITIVRLGTPRETGESLRLGTVRRPPRGVRKIDYARKDFYDVWLPMLSPSAELLRQWKSASNAAELSGFKRKFSREMHAPDPSRLLDLLAALSHQTEFSIGCYCKDEADCHRSVLRHLLLERGAAVYP